MQHLIRNTGIAYLLLLMLLKTLALPLICLHYHFNKAYIAANLCENKARLAMQCNGKCQLRKQLAKASESDSSSNQQVNSVIAVVDYCNDLYLLDFNYSSHSTSSFPLYQVAAFAAGYPGNVFHPPIA